MTALDWTEAERLIDIALAEDIGRGDLTTRLVIPEDATAEFTVMAREAIVVAGAEVAARVFRKVEPGCTVAIDAPDGTRAEMGTALARVSGQAHGLLTAERTALNFLQFLSGIATTAAAFVDRIAGTGTTMVDTRKTIPGLRSLSKYAAWVGGVRNHRLRLDDGVLVKDNHLSVAGGIAPAMAQLRRGTPLLTKIEVECDSLDQVTEALAAGADMILLDNMTLDEMREAVRLANGRIPLEASGGVTLETVRAIAETGVRFISTSKLTQSAAAVDIGLDIRIET